MEDTDLQEILRYLVHEIRNPALGISSTLGAWESTFTPSEEQKEYVSAMRSGLDRICLTLEAVAAWTRPLRLDRATRSPSGALEDAVIQSRAEAVLRHVTISDQVDPDLAPIHADFRLLSNAITLLIGAAIDRTPKDGMIEVTAVGARRRALVVTVRDGARPPRDDERAEELFEFRPGPRQRAAFGLAVARKIIEAHAGTLAARFVSGGTFFTVTVASPPAGP